MPGNIYPEDLLGRRFLADDYDLVEEKPNATTCEEYQTTSLLTYASKILLKVITRRLQAKTEADKSLGDDQFGFRIGRGTKICDRSLKSVDRKKSRAQSRSIHTCMLCGLRKSI